jgi:hypothetical protein
MTQFGRALHQLNIDIICANALIARWTGSSTLANSEPSSLGTSSSHHGYRIEARHGNSSSQAALPDMSNNVF